MRYKSDRIIDGRRKTVIVEDDNIVHRNPSKEELKDNTSQRYSDRNIKRFPSQNHNKRQIKIIFISQQSPLVDINLKY